MKSRQSPLPVCVPLPRHWVLQWWQRPSGITHRLWFWPNGLQQPWQHLWVYCIPAIIMFRWTAKCQFHVWKAFWIRSCLLRSFIRQTRKNGTAAGSGLSAAVWGRGIYLSGWCGCTGQTPQQDSGYWSGIYHFYVRFNRKAKGYCHQPSECHWFYGMDGRSGQIFITGRSGKSGAFLFWFVR